ncbi:MAG TPA: hypothetical protein VGH10_00840 [Actinomycetota bacterium]|jgi:hypothetical protein
MIAPATMGDWMMFAGLLGLLAGTASAAVAWAFREPDASTERAEPAVNGAKPTQADRAA